MKNTTKSLAAAGLVSLMALSAPAVAQVQGNIATVDTPTSLMGTTAFQTAYNQITESYKAQIDTRRDLQAQRQTVLQQLDSNDDNEVNDAELAAAEGTPQMAQLDQIDGQIATLTNQIDGARIFVVEQVSAHYGTSLQEVIAAEQIQMLISPEAILLAPPEADISGKVAAQINTKITEAQIVPPQGWAPQRGSVALYQQIQQYLVTARLIQQQQAQAQAAQQGQQPATEAPVGR